MHSGGVSGWSSSLLSRTNNKNFLGAGIGNHYLCGTGCKAEKILGYIKEEVIFIHVMPYAMVSYGSSSL